MSRHFLTANTGRGIHAARRSRWLRFSLAWPLALVVLAVQTLVGGVSPARAQQTVVSTPFRQSSSSFNEFFGFGWGFNFNSRTTPAFFRQGGFNGALPPFGGFNPNSAAQFGFGLQGNGGSAFFNGMAGQGSNRSMVSQTPMVTIPNGGFGAISNTRQRPFVTGLVPIVGDAPPSPLQMKLHDFLTRAELEATQAAVDRAAREEARDAASRRAESAPTVSRSTAEHGDASVADLKAERAARQAAEKAAAEAELAVLVARAEAAEAEGKFGAARVYYQQAMRRAEGELRQELAARHKALVGR